VHELSLAEELVTKCLRWAEGRTVLEVRVRCSAAIDVDDLAEGFALLAPQAGELGGDASLRHAQLKIETVPVLFECSCGFAGEVGPERLAGHVGICPRCDRVGEVPASMELLAMSFVTPDASGPGGLFGLGCWDLGPYPNAVPGC